jgi:DNA-binding NarL/FixJ family response regulator
VASPQNNLTQADSFLVVPRDHHQLDGVLSSVMKVDPADVLGAGSTHVIRIALIDERPLLRDGLTEILANIDDFAVVGSAADVSEAVECVRERPDVVIIHVHAQGHSATVLVGHARSEFPNCRIIVLGVEDSSEAVHSLVAIGINGYLTDPTRDDLVAAIRSSVAREGHLFLSVRREALMRSQAISAAPAMSEREVEILVLAAEALSNSQIARRLQLTEATVKRHLRNIYAKLNAVSRIDAVNKAVDAELLTRPQRQ